MFSNTFKNILKKLYLKILVEIALDTFGNIKSIVY